MLDPVRPVAPTSKFSQGYTLPLGCDYDLLLERQTGSSASGRRASARR